MTQADSAPQAEYLQYICNACGYIYKEVDGDPDSGLAPGTRFADIPDDWECPLCAVTKSDFVLYQPVDPRTRLACTPARPAPRGKGARAGVVIVGAGRAGWQMAESIRDVDADVPIALEQLVRETGAQAAQRLGVNLLAQTQASSLSLIRSLPQPACKRPTGWHRPPVWSGTTALPWTRFLCAPATPASTPWATASRCGVKPAATSNPSPARPAP